MTEKEIEMERYIKDSILPKLQEMQRDLYFDKHVSMSVALSEPYYGVDVWVGVREDREEACSGFLALEHFSFRTYEDEAFNGETLADVRSLIGEWQERLG